MIAKLKGISIAEFAKQSILKEIAPVRVDLAFDLLKQGKIGRKKAWFLSGLSFHEFMVEWSKRGAEEVLPDDLVDKELDLMRNIDLSKYLREAKQ